MSGIFPNSTDGGLPPNPSDPSNPTHAFPPTVSPVNTAALYYGNGCDVRLRPEVVNSLISEQIALIDIAQVAYDPARLINLQLATRYLIQRGLPRASALTQVTANNYAAALNPVSTGYNDYMTLSVVPNTTNSGAVQVNLDGRGYVQLLRNDGQQLLANDILAGRPFQMMYYQGKWYYVGLVASQVGAISQSFGLNVVVYSSGTSTTGGGPGPFVVPAGVFVLREIEIAGAGGGGGSGGVGGGAAGGGNGGVVVRGSMMVTPGQAIDWGVGPGGAAGAGGSDGGPGGDTVFSTWRAPGGKGGHANGNPGDPWDGTSAGGSIVYSGQQADSGWVISTFLRGGHGGNSVAGGLGGQGSQNGGTAGNPGVGAGGGGGGGATGAITTGGPGSNGRILIRY